MTSSCHQDRAVENTTYNRKLEAKFAAALASAKHTEHTLRTRLRSQSTDLDYLEAENAEQRATIKKFQTKIVRLQTIQQIDTKDLIHLAGKLLALSQATGVELGNTTVELFRRRGWISAASRTEAKER